MKITLICGSVAKKSHTHALLVYIESLLKKKNIETIFWDLKEKHLPIVIPEYHSKVLETPNETTIEFVKLVMGSDGLVLGSPLYHGSYAGVLKNALDNLGEDLFRNKAVGLVGNASTVRSPQALEHLRSVVRALYGYATQTHIATMRSDYEEGDEGYTLVNEDIKTRCQRLVNELVNLTKIYKKHAPNKKD